MKSTLMDEVLVRISSNNGEYQMSNLREDSSSAHEKLRLTALCTSTKHRIDHGVSVLYKPGWRDSDYKLGINVCGYLILINEKFYIYTNWKCNVDVNVVVYADGTTSEPDRIESWKFDTRISEEAKKLGIYQEPV